MLSDQEALWVKHYPRFAANDEPALNRLRAIARLVSLPGGQRVFHAGSPCNQYLMLLEGSVRVQLLTTGGREVLLYRVRPGGTCILTTSCLLGGNHYPAEGITEKPVKAFAIPEAGFQQALNDSAFFRRFVFCDFSERLGRVIARIEELVSGDIDQRLIKTLLGGESATISKTHQQLALDVGTAREVVSRHLQQYQSQGWIRLSRGRIQILDTSALQQALEACEPR